MKSIEIKNFNELIEFISRYRKSASYKFRGQSDKEWKLVPNAGRTPFKNRDDKELFKQWKRRAFAYISRENYDEWEILSIAQHYGVPTRMLDWTHNPLIATFFSCIENFDKDGALYTIKPDGFINTKTMQPFELPNNTVAFYQPLASNERIMNQFGYFSIHTKPEIELDEKTGNSTLEKIIIPASIKKEIIFALNQFGINNLTIYPDLEGLSKHLTWFYTNYEYWDGSLQ